MTKKRGASFSKTSQSFARSLVLKRSHPVREPTACEARYPLLSSSLVTWGGEKSSKSSVLLTRSCCRSSRSLSFRLLARMPEPSSALSASWGTLRGTVASGDDRALLREGRRSSTVQVLGIS